MTIDEHYAELCNAGWTSTREVFNAGYRTGLADAAALCDKMDNVPFSAGIEIRAMGEAK